MNTVGKGWKGGKGHASTQFLAKWCYTE